MWIGIRIRIRIGLGLWGSVSSLGSAYKVWNRSEKGKRKKKKNYNNNNNFKIIIITRLSLSLMRRQVRSTLKKKKRWSLGILPHVRPKLQNFCVVRFFSFCAIMGPKALWNKNTSVLKLALELEISIRIPIEEEFQLQSQLQLQPSPYLFSRKRK